MYLIFDTETTGLPKNYNAPVTDLDNWPRLVQLAWQLHGSKGELLIAKNYIVKPVGFTIPFNAEKIHGISTKRALEEGHDLKFVLEEFAKDVETADALIGHNVSFDMSIMGAEYIRGEVENSLMETATIDTKEESTDYVKIPGGRGGKYKWPTLTELHTKLFGVGFDDAHDAAYDVDATAKCFFGLLTEAVIAPLDGQSLDNIVYEPPVLDDANFKKAEKKKSVIEEAESKVIDKLIPFSHLHVHSQFSILQSTSSVKDLIKKAKENKMPAVAFTDHGNLHAAFNAVAGQDDDIKVIIGCEFYVAEERKKTQFTKDSPDRRFNQVLIAKDQEAYQRLSRLCSIGYVEGFYSQMPRIDKDLIVDFKEGLIALTGNLSGEIPNLILNKGEDEAEEAFKWWHDLFGDDFYVELMRHGLPEEDKVNEVLLGFAKKYNVKPIATNNSYYMEKGDANAHDVLWCVKEGKNMNMEVGPGRRYRYALPNDQFYFKTQEEMNKLFADIPESLENTKEIVDKCSPLKLKRDILLPKFDMPERFKDQNEYLKYLTYEGAKPRYEFPEEWTADKEFDGTNEPLEGEHKEIMERINYELDIIKTMGFPGYFLIVQDFIGSARDMGVSVGPGRGSAAGSVVAFCTGITNIDPIKYNLLFERFLNPERVSMPDIDIDFDDRGRQDVIDWVVQKYGKNQVAQIITYGTMAAKMSIKDVARALELPLPESNALAKLVPDAPGTSLTKAFEEVPELDDILKGKKGLEIPGGDQALQTKTLNLAKKLEGSVRGTGIHAAGVIIAPDDLLDYIPVCTAKDADLLVTQFDGKVVEDAGMLKMDFLGLKTLTIIKDALKLIKKNHDIDIDIDEIPLDDEKTFDLYTRGETVGTFQFESEGMRLYLKQLKPTNIEDLIAMNALYRPGPLQFIPNFIDRKHGKEEIEYPHPMLEPLLNYSNGIMVYQEQIMQTAQVLAGYTLGGADILRRAMGKKKLSEMEKQKAIFIKGAKEKNDIDEKQATEIFAIMEKFAAYGFNRSHSAAYSVVAYQTGYLKANYPAQYMAAVMSNSMGTIEKISFFMDECKHINLKVLGPDINESARDFDVNEEGAIRFGLGAIKGTGDAAVDSIIEEREKNGRFIDIWDFVERVNLRTVNKKTVESLAYGGAFDGFGEMHRAQFFAIPEGENTTGIEKLLKFGSARQAEKNSAQVSLFGAGSGVELPKPKVADCEPWSELIKLRHEKEVVGFYISGHPLDLFKMEMDSFCVKLEDVHKHKTKEIGVGGIISQVNIRQAKNGSNFALFTVEDYISSVGMAMFKEKYMKNAHMLKAGEFVYIKGKVEERYNQPGQWELMPHTIMPLAEVKDKFCNKVIVQIDISELTERLVADLQTLIAQNTGNCQMRFEIFDKEKNTKLDMLSRKFKIDPNNDLLNSLQRLEGVSCKVA